MQTKLHNGFIFTGRLSNGHRYSSSLILFPLTPNNGMQGTSEPLLTKKKCDSAFLFKTDVH